MTTDHDLSFRQKQVLRFIIAFQRVNRYTPSIKDIATAGLVNKYAVAKVIDHLVEKGHLEKSPIGTIKMHPSVMLPPAQ